MTDVLIRLVCETNGRGETILVPAFAVGRAQHLLHLLAELRREARIPELPVVLDSPIAIVNADLLCSHRRPPAHRTQLPYALPDRQYTRTPGESKAIDRRPGPMVVISASGMATGGRIHLRRFLPDERSAGFHAGTRARSLVDGADELKIHGQYVPVRARVAQVQGLSAHADYAELLAWLESTDLAPRRVFVTHGLPPTRCAGACATNCPGRRSSPKLDQPGI